MKGRKIISLVLSLVMLLSLAIVPTSAAEAEDGKTFEDVQEHWGKGSVERWAGYGVLKGDETGAFNPDKSMTRAEFATMLVNLMGYTEQAENTFADVPADAWYADAILKLAAAGVMQGDGVNANPNATISREETAVLLCRAMNITPSATASVDFADAGSVASWAQDAVAALVERGMIQGMGDNQFAPTLDITRASVAKMVDNMVAVYVVDDAQEITGDIKGVVIVAAAADVTIKDANLAENLIVAPKAADATVALTGKTVAKDVIVSGSGAAVKVGEDAKAASVVADAPKAEVSVAGTVSEVKSTAAAEASSLTVEKGAKVDTVVTDAPKGSVAVNAPVKSIEAGENAAEGSVEIAKGVTVDTLKTDAPIKVDNQGTVKKAEVNTSDVVIDGNAPKEMEVPKDVEKPTNSKGEEVKEPSTGGGGGGSSGGSNTPAPVTYGVTLSSGIANGTIKTSSASAAAGATVTITGEPEAGYALKSITVSDVAETNRTGANTFTFIMPAKDVTVTAEFANPLTKFDVFVVNDQTSYNKVPVEVSGSDTPYGDIAVHPWLAINTEKGIDGTIQLSGITFKLDGTTLAPSFIGTELGAWRTAYIGVKPYAKEADALNAESYYGVVSVSLTYMGVEYSAVVTSTDPSKTYFDVTFNVGGGSAIPQQKVEENGKVVKPADPIRNGYTFGGWHKTSSTGDAWSFDNDQITGNTTIYASWTPVTYTITYDLDGGTNYAQAPENYTIETAKITLGTPTKSGYTFLGWFDAKTGGSEVTTIETGSTGNKTLYARWEVEKAVITINAATQTVTYTGEKLAFEIKSSQITTGFTLVYQQSGQVKDPTNAGTYDVVITRDEDGTYKAFNQTITGGLIIDKATQDAPSGLEGVAPTSDSGSDGKITGTTTAMEYSTDSAFAAPAGTACGEGETTGLSNDTYYVRMKADANHEASPNTRVEVPEYTAEPPATCTCTLGDPVFSIEAIEIGAAEADKTVELNATATLTSAGCPVHGNTSGTVTYTYEVTAAGETGAEIVNSNQLKVTAAGTATIQVTASANDKTSTATASVSVTQANPTTEEELKSALNVRNEVILGANITISENETLDIAANKTLTIPANITLTVEGTLTNNGTLAGAGTVKLAAGKSHTGTAITAADFFCVNSKESHAKINNWTEEQDENWDDGTAPTLPWAAVTYTRKSTNATVTLEAVCDEPSVSVTATLNNKGDIEKAYITVNAENNAGLAAGTYTVTLTIADNGGLTTVMSTEVAISAYTPPTE